MSLDVLVQRIGGVDPSDVSLAAVNTRALYAYPRSPGCGFIAILTWTRRVAVEINLNTISRRKS